MLELRTGILVALVAVTFAACTSYPDPTSSEGSWNTTRVGKDWRLDFEAKLPRSDVFFNGTTHDVALSHNHDQPLSGGGDLRLTAVLNGTNREGWAGVWVKDPSDLDMDASGSVGLRFKFKSSTARTIQVMLSSMAYPDYKNGSKLTGSFQATKGVQDVELKFKDFQFPSWLYKSGQLCGSADGAKTYCSTSMEKVLERVNAIQFQIDPRWDSAGTVEDDWASIQVDDVRFVFP
ncbi:MAG: hypothetical protein RL173_2518 [Fibrobacterota bacterium]|jgi:hypothetical protein